ncbi:hypothetical protein [Caenispirillum salinarum]|uniref:hypothetical protein n=1 Tax=Caenispirillum salinarum TaxID=859058 RepID=UPI003850CBAD
MSSSTFQRHGMPSAIIGLVVAPVPLWSVTAISLTSSYHLPPIGTQSDRVLMDSHDDRISLTAVLPGQLRFAWKEALETFAEQAIAWNPLQDLTNGEVGGLFLWTSMTLRTDIYIESLTFSASAQKRKALDVSMTLAHLPRPGLLPQALDVPNVAISSAIDPFTG